jgi:hypothetical protein
MVKRAVLFFRYVVEAYSAYTLVVAALLIAGCGAVVAYWASILENITGPSLYLTGVLGSAALTAVFYKWCRADQVRRGPRLSLAEGLPLDTSHYDLRAEVYPIGVTNVQQRRATTAHNLAATVILIDADGLPRQAEGIWLIESVNGSGPWRRQESLEGLTNRTIHVPLVYRPTGSEQYFLLDARQMEINSHGHLMRVHPTPALPLGRLKVSVTVKGDHMWETTWKASLNISAKRAWFDFE